MFTWRAYRCLEDWEKKGKMQAAEAISRQTSPRADWAIMHPALQSSEQLAAEWRKLAESAAEPNAFAEYWFVAAGLSDLASDENPQMLQVWSGTREDRMLLGLLPLRLSPHYGRAPIVHVQNWTHFHSFLGTPLVRAGYEQRFWRAVLLYLDADAWARGFLHINGLTEDGPVHNGLTAAAGDLERPCDIVHQSERALLQTDLSPQDYFERTVRKKKRKELKRLSSRLAELGSVEVRSLSTNDELGPWCDDFLRLEQLGWKGRNGSALACDPATNRFFRNAVSGAFAAGRLDFLRLDLNGKAIAMLVNFMAPPGSFSFKIAFDEDYARFSPGVLIQLENYRIIARDSIQWMDSCAIEDHPMINSLWAERRSLIRVTVPLAGFTRRAAFRFCRLAEETSAILRTQRRKLVSLYKQASQDE